MKKDKSKLLMKLEMKFRLLFQNYIYQCCKDKTQQFSAGLLLESVLGNMNARDIERFATLAKDILKDDRKGNYIVDSRYRAQLIILILQSKATIGKQLKSIIKNSDWLVKSKLLYQSHRQCHRHPYVRYL